MIIGEAPGQREDISGEPFVGQAGKVLNEVLPIAGLSRETVFITNTIKCRPPQNRNPLPEETAACAPYLDEQIMLIEPTLILLLGSHAMRRMIPDAPSITRCHGDLFNRELGRMIPLFHPAATLYDRSKRALLEADMLRVRAYLQRSSH